ncbi:cytochrome P450 [Mycena rebaudengoi]|nr:cytochrome P450 [Mycena rebaudengoi]
MISQILYPVAGTLFCFAMFHMVQFLYCELTFPLRHVVGPRNPSFAFGNFKQMGDNAQFSKCRSEFGRTFRFKSLFGISELHTSDIKAINHVLTNGTIYRRVPFRRDHMRRILGNGILSVDLAEHKRQACPSHFYILKILTRYMQRRILNPAFGITQVRLLTEIFVEKSIQLRDIWARQIRSREEHHVIDVFPGLRRMTLDVISQAGFDYQIDSLNAEGNQNELDQVFTELLHSSHAQSDAAFRLAQSIVPILKLLPLPGTQIRRRARRAMDCIGRQIVASSKAALSASEGGQVLGGKRDLLSVLLRSTLSKEVPENQRLNEAEVVALIPTFLFAGHETTSSAVSWALHALSLNNAAQSKLRQELLTLCTENPTMDELNTLPYLESVVRETLRVHSPFVFNQRMAMEDDILPLAKPYVDQKGKSHHNLPIPKGQIIHIPILAVNTDKEIWGDDADEFKPERWEHIPEATSEIPGVCGNILSFFAGPHNCIGFRFSLVEIKTLLFTLIRAFEFEPAVPIVPTSFGLQAPMVSGTNKGSSLPLVLRAYNGRG